MSRKDRNLDDLLNFDYGRPVPDERPDGRANRYEQNSHAESQSERNKQRQSDEAKVYAELRKQAQKEAYEKYRSTYGKNKSDSSRRVKRKAGKFYKGLSVLYLVCLAAFVAIMTIMNILPLFTLILLYVILILLSLIVVVQLRKNNIAPVARNIASVTSVLLMIMYLLGSAYAIGTLSFLSYTSVDNESRVAKITKDPFNVVMTGIDVEGTIDKEGLSDVNMVVTVNPVTEEILMTSIPRDYQIYMPDMGGAMDKLTHTGFYSVETTIGAAEDLLGVKMNYYVKVNFATVMKFVNAVGGIDVYSEYEFVPVKRKKMTVKKGWNHFNGVEALAFARERKAFEDGDRQRIKNQQAVLEAVINKVMSSRTMALSYNKILSELKKYFEMSFNSKEMRSLVKLQLAKNPKWNITKNSITGGDGSLATYTTGGTAVYIMTQDPQSIETAKSLISAVMNGQKLKTEEDGTINIIEKTDND